jgi:hypothetical protein
VCTIRQTCYDGIRNQDESGIDYPHPSLARAYAGHVVTLLCNRWCFIKTIGIDCGGYQCAARCGINQGCNSGDDCAIGYDICYNGFCQAAMAADGIQNYGETGIDCKTPLSSPASFVANVIQCHYLFVARNRWWSFRWLCIRARLLL